MVIRYNYNKYKVVDTRVFDDSAPWVPSPVDLGYTNMGVYPNDNFRWYYAYDSYTLNKNTGLYKLTGEHTGIQYYGTYLYDPSRLFSQTNNLVPTIVKVTLTLVYQWADGTKKFHINGQTKTAVLLSGNVVKGDFIENIIANDGTYPDDGYRVEDGFWYTKKSTVVSVNVGSIVPTHVYKRGTTININTIPAASPGEVVLYKASLNGAAYKPYGSIQGTAGIAELIIPEKDLALGSNTVLITGKDSESNESSATATVYKEVPYRLKVDRTFTSTDGGYLITNS